MELKTQPRFCPISFRMPLALCSSSMSYYPGFINIAMKIVNYHEFVNFMAKNKNKDEDGKKRIKLFDELPPKIPTDSDGMPIPFGGKSASVGKKSSGFHSSPSRFPTVPLFSRTDGPSETFRRRNFSVCPAVLDRKVKPQGQRPQLNSAGVEIAFHGCPERSGIIT